MRGGGQSSLSVRTSRVLRSGTSDLLETSRSTWVWPLRSSKKKQCALSMPVKSWLQGFWTSFSDGPRQDGPSAKDHIYFLLPPPPPGDLYRIGPDKHSSTLIGRHKPSAVHIHIASSHCWSCVAVHCTDVPLVFPRSTNEALSKLSLTH